MPGIPGEDEEQPANRSARSLEVRIVRSEQS